jgi:hypothetical protein
MTYGPHTHGKSSWGRAHSLLAGAMEASGDNLGAALEMARAAELVPHVQEYAEALGQLLRRIPDKLGAIVKVD